MKSVLLILVVLAQAPAVAQDCFDFAGYLPILNQPQTSASITDVDVEGDRAYLAADYDGLVIVDIADPTMPDTLGIWGADLIVDDAAAAGDGRCLVVIRDQGLMMLDCTDPTAPVVLDEKPTVYPFRELAVVGTIAYVVSPDYGLFLYDISDPQVISGLAAVPALHAVNVAVTAGMAFLACESSGLRIVDVSSPGSAHLVATLPLFNTVTAVATDGDLAVAVGRDSYGGTDSGRLATIDMTDPSQPGEPVVITLAEAGGEVALRDGLAFIAIYDHGLDVYDVADPAVPVRVGYRELPGWPRGLALGDDLAICGYGGSWNIIGIAQPRWAQPVGTVATPASATTVTAAGDVAVVAMGLAGLAVVDVTAPEQPQLVGQLDTDGVAFHVTLAGDLLLVADGAGGLLTVDLADPATPVIRGTVATGGAARHVAVSGTLACVAEGTAGMEVVDFSDPAQPVILGGLETPGVAGHVILDDAGLAYVADGPGGLRIIDLTDPTTPVEVGTLAFGTTCLATWIQGTTLLVMTGNGIQTVDVSDPAWCYVVDITPIDGLSRSLQVLDDAVYVGVDSQTVQVYRFQAPFVGMLLGTMHTVDRATGLGHDGHLIYVADAQGGLRIMPPACGVVTAAPTAESLPVAGVSLAAPAPNPFNPRCTCRFILDRDQDVTVAVFDVRGRLVRQLLDGRRSAGEHQVVWDGRDRAGRDLPSGVYLVQVRGEQGRDARRLTLVR